MYAKHPYACTHKSSTLLIQSRSPTLFNILFIIFEIFTIWSCMLVSLPDFHEYCNYFIYLDGKEEKRRAMEKNS